MEKQSWREHEKCKYNPFVNCEDECKKCHKCGWNPVVKKKRLKKIRKEYNHD